MQCCAPRCSLIDLTPSIPEHYQNTPNPSRRYKPSQGWCAWNPLAFTPEVATGRTGKAGVAATRTHIQFADEEEEEKPRAQPTAKDPSAVDDLAWLRSKAKPDAPAQNGEDAAGKDADGAKGQAEEPAELTGRLYVTNIPYSARSLSSCGWRAP